MWLSFTNVWDSGKLVYRIDGFIQPFRALWRKRHTVVFEHHLLWWSLSEVHVWFYSR